jgi:hypothetical protein
VCLITVLSLACLVSTPKISPSIQTTPIQESNTLEAKTGSSNSSHKLPLCPITFPEFIQGTDSFQPHNLDEPLARQPYTDPVFGTCIIRVTDNSSDVTSSEGFIGLKNEYSRVQSFNADGSRLLARGTNGSWFLYDATTLLPLMELPLEMDPRWDAKSPDLIYYSSGTRLQSYNITSNSVSMVHDFSNDLPGEKPELVWTRYEGSPSADGRYWGLMVEDANWLTTDYFIYDLKEDTVISMQNISALPEEAREIDSVTISPFGNYYLVYHDKYCDTGTLGSTGNPCGLMVFDRNLENSRGLLRVIGHSDLALDENEREVLVFQDIDADSISMLDIETGKVTPLLNIDFSKISVGLHFSGRAFLRPGWAVISTYTSQTETITWMDNQVFLIELKPNGKVIRLAFTRSIVDESQEHDYWAEPQASANADLSRVVFTSNWGRSGTEEVNMYLIEVPLEWFF